MILGVGWVLYRALLELFIITLGNDISFKGGYRRCEEARRGGINRGEGSEVGALTIKSEEVHFGRER